MDEQYYLNKLLNFILLLFLYMAYDMIWNMEGKDLCGFLWRWDLFVEN